MPEFIKDDCYFNVLEEDGNFWERFKNKDWEFGTLEAIRTILKPDSDYLDIGGWCGPTAIYASYFCRRVITLEPDIVAYKNLVSNIDTCKRNNIFAIKAALSANNDSVAVSSTSKLGNSQSNTIGRGQAFGRVKAFTIVDMLDMFNITKLGLLKMDIEGGEYDILPQCLDLLGPMQVPMHLSFHPPFYNGVNKDKITIDIISKLEKHYSHHIGNMHEIVAGCLTSVFVY